jgi:hypothetical protein
MIPGFDVGISASTSSGVQDGDKRGTASTGDFIFGGSKSAVPQWVWLAAVALVAIVVWKKFLK